jgi:hypothetical protein
MSITGFMDGETGAYAIRMPESDGFIGVLFGNSTEPDHWSLLLILKLDSHDIAWSARRRGKSLAHQAAGIVWATGRITSHASLCERHKDEPMRFKEFIDGVGLSFGAIEAELRSMTGYTEELH